MLCLHYILLMMMLPTLCMFYQVVRDGASKGSTETLSST